MSFGADQEPDVRIYDSDEESEASTAGDGDQIADGEDQESDIDLMDDRSDASSMSTTSTSPWEYSDEWDYNAMEAYQWWEDDDDDDDDSAALLLAESGVADGEIMVPCCVYDCELLQQMKRTVMEKACLPDLVAAGSPKILTQQRDSPTPTFDSAATLVAAGLQIATNSRYTIDRNLEDHLCNIPGPAGIYADHSHEEWHRNAFGILDDWVKDQNVDRRLQLMLAHGAQSNCSIQTLLALPSDNRINRVGLVVPDTTVFLATVNVAEWMYGTTTVSKQGFLYVKNYRNLPDFMYDLVSNKRPYYLTRHATSSQHGSEQALKLFFTWQNAPGQTNLVVNTDMMEKTTKLQYKFVDIRIETIYKFSKTTTV